jgi:hypothetical protein
MGQHSPRNCQSSASATCARRAFHLKTRKNSFSASLAVRRAAVGDATPREWCSSRSNDGSCRYSRVHEQGESEVNGPNCFHEGKHVIMTIDLRPPATDVIIADARRTIHAAVSPPAEPEQSSSGVGTHILPCLPHACLTMRCAYASRPDSVDVGASDPLGVPSARRPTGRVPADGFDKTVKLPRTFSRERRGPAAADDDDDGAAADHGAAADDGDALSASAAAGSLRFDCELLEMCDALCGTLVWSGVTSRRSFSSSLPSLHLRSDGRARH